MFSKVSDFVRKNTVALIAAIAALATSFIVKPDAKYLTYFDFRTLTCLFCVLAVVCALKNVNFFYMLAHKIVRRFKNVRMCITALVYITFIGSMLIANDMALLTFLPLGYFVLNASDSRKYMAFTFIMQNIAANLGGMLTPFGNPQNLYLYSKFSIPESEFLRIMAPPFIISVFIITVCCMFIPADKIDVPDEELRIEKGRVTVYLILFVLAIAIVFRGVPYILGLVVIPAALFFLDRKALRQVDYSLLLTFVFFFIFAGNMARIGIVQHIFSYFLSKSTLLFSILSCQVISNVPSAILLSQFTDNYADLLLGVNIGGVGTLISSLASLITLREYSAHNPGKTVRYIGQFSAVNFAFLALLTLSMTFIKLL